MGPKTENLFYLRDFMFTSLRNNLIAKVSAAEVIDDKDNPWDNSPDNDVGENPVEDLGKFNSRLSYCSKFSRTY